MSIEDVFARSGYTIVAVSNEEADYSHTLGLLQTEGVEWFVDTGCDEIGGMLILNLLTAFRKARIPLEKECYIQGFLSHGIRLALIEADAKLKTTHLTGVSEYFPGVNYKVMQVVLPALDNRFPWSQTEGEGTSEWQKVYLPDLDSPAGRRRLAELPVVELPLYAPTR